MQKIIVEITNDSCKWQIVASNHIDWLQKSSLFLGFVLKKQKSNDQII